jgi:hypothetical protein
MTACRPGWTAGRERWRRPAATQDYTNFNALPIFVIFYAGKTHNRLFREGPRPFLTHEQRAILRSKNLGHLEKTPRNRR